MKVRAEFFSRLREIAGTPAFEVELPSSATIEDFFQELCRRFPSMRDFETSALFAVGVEFVSREQALREGDEIAVMPPVQGG